MIGSGPAGEKGAARAAYFDKKVALIEAAPSYGGAVANPGVPGKATRLYEYAAYDAMGKLQRGEVFRLESQGGALGEAIIEAGR